MHRILFPLDILVVLFGLSALLLGTPPSYNPALSVPVQLGVLAGVLVYIILAHGILHWKTAYTLGRLTLLAGAAWAVLLILQYAHQNYGETPAIIQRMGELTTLLPDLGFFVGHPNAVATFLEVMIPLGVVLTLTSSRWIVKSLWIVCTLFCLYALLLTFSRGALVALAVTALIAGIVLARAWSIRLLALLILLLGVAVMIFTTAGSDWIFTRWVLYRNSLFVASDYVFTGIGLGDTFPMVYSRYGLLIEVPQLTYPHNLLLSVWTGQGLPGLLVFVALVVTFYLFVRRVLRAQPRRLFHAAWLGVTVSLAHGLFDSRHYVEALWLMPVLFGFVGLAAATGRMALAEWWPDNQEANIRYFPWKAAAVVMAALLVGAAVFNQELRAAWYTNQGALAETRAELADGLEEADREALVQEAQAYYQQALTLAPRWPGANRRLGNMLTRSSRFEQAVAPLETAYAGEPTNPAAMKGLGLAYLWNGRVEEAVRLFVQLDEPSEMQEELHAWGAWRGQRQNQPLLSAYAYEAAQMMSPDAISIPYWEAIAEAYAAANHPEQARAWYERILTEEPDNEDARQALSVLDDNV